MNFESQDNQESRKRKFDNFDNMSAFLPDRLPEASTLAEFLENPTKFRPKEEFILSTWIEDETVLTHCVKNQMVSAVISLLKSGADPNLSSRRGVTPISAAAHKGNVIVMQHLINAGATVNAINTSGSTALIQAAHFGHLDAVKLLIKNSADTDFANVKGTTALMRSCQEGHVDISRCLVDAGVDVNRKNHEGMNALMLASQRGHAEIVFLLIEAGAAMDEQTSQGSTALMLACKRGHEKCAEVLVSMGAEIFMRDRRGRTARDTATRRNHFGLLCWLDTTMQVSRIQAARHHVRSLCLVDLRNAYFEGNVRLKPADEFACKIAQAVKAEVKARQNNTLSECASSSSVVANFLASSVQNPYVSRSPEAAYKAIESLYLPQPVVDPPAKLSKYSQLSSKVVRRAPDYADWQWSALLHKCLGLPHGVFESIADYLPLPRVWQWSLVRIKRRAKLNPQQAMLDMSRTMDEMLCDANIFACTEQTYLLVKISRSPQIHDHLVDTLGMPVKLLEDLCKWADVQSLLYRVNAADVQFKISVAKQMFDTTIELYRWVRHRSSASKTLGLISTAVPLSLLLSNEGEATGEYTNAEMDDGDMMEATDAGGEEEEEEEGSDNDMAVYDPMLEHAEHDGAEQDLDENLDDSDDDDGPVMLPPFAHHHSNMSLGSM